MKLALNIESNLGYSADQVDGGMTLADLQEAVEQAIADHGEDAEVVIYQTNNRYGASWGVVSRYEDMFTAHAADDEDESREG